MKRSRSWARRCAVQALYQWQLAGDEQADADLSFLAADDADRVNRSYFRELLQQVTGRTVELDQLIAPLLDRRLEEVDPVERAILRVGGCELAWHAEIPYRVVINEAVELAKVFGAEHGHKYVNGILDKLAHQLRETETAAAR